MHGTPHVSTGVGFYQIHLDEFARENNIIIVEDAETPTALVVILQSEGLSITEADFLPSYDRIAVNILQFLKTWNVEALYRIQSMCHDVGILIRQGDADDAEDHQGDLHIYICKYMICVHVFECMIYTIHIYIYEA